MNEVAAFVARFDPKNWGAVKPEPKPKGSPARLSLARMVFMAGGGTYAEWRRHYNRAYYLAHPEINLRRAINNHRRKERLFVKSLNLDKITCHESGNT